MNWSDVQKRRGTWEWALPPFPFALGIECAGTIASIPTDERTLQDVEYKARTFTVGSRVVTVSMHIPVSACDMALIGDAAGRELWPWPYGGILRHGLEQRLPSP